MFYQIFLETGVMLNSPLVGSSFSGWKRRTEYFSLAVSCLEPGNNIGNQSQTIDKERF